MFAAQIEFIKWLQQIRNPLLDHCVSLLDYLDRQEFLFVLIPVIWFAFNWQWGMRLFYLLSLNHLVNFGLKNVFALPRPFHLDPFLGVIHVKNYGFPSGAAQTAVLLSGLLILNWKTRWRWVVAPCYILLLSFSRLYLGVHFPMDIVGGWLAGLLLLGIYCSLFPLVEGQLRKLTPITIFLINQAAFLLLLFIVPTKTMIGICACGMGLGIGVFINQKLKTSPYKPSASELIGQLVIGISGVFLIASIFSTLFPRMFGYRFIQFLTIGLWISFFTMRCASFCLKNTVN